MAAAATTNRGPDADLLSKVERWLAVEAEHAALYEQECAADARNDKAEKDRLYELMVAGVPAQHELRDAIFQIRPQTLEGLRGQARVIFAYWGEEEHSGSSEECMSFNFAEYALGLMDRADPERDGELVALLDRARELMRAPQPVDHLPTLASILVPKPWEAPLHAAASIPAHTPAGIRAKAETVADWLAGQDRRTGPGFSCDREAAVAWSLMRDILGADELAPVPPLRRPWTEEDETAAAASMPPPVVLPAVPDIPWMWSNAAAAIRDLPVQDYRLSTACILEAQRAQEVRNDIRAHNLLMAASTSVHEQMRALDVQYAINTEVVPKAAPLVPGTVEHREHRAMQIRTLRSIVRGNLRELRRVQREHGLPLPANDGAVMRQAGEVPQ